VVLTKSQSKPDSLVNQLYLRLLEKDNSFKKEVGIEPTRTKNPLDFEFKCLVIQSKMSERGRHGFRRTMIIAKETPLLNNDMQIAT
jgi:hypothetical protein